jgi:hypothetical protein
VAVELWALPGGGWLAVRAGVPVALEVPVSVGDGLALRLVREEWGLLLRVGESYVQGGRRRCEVLKARQVA